MDFDMDKLEKLEKLARTKLIEHDIEWKEDYTNRTLFLKKQFEEIIGPGSYFRFEGEDDDSGDRYYCIIGPAGIKKPRAKYFAGVRKLPATYSAGGKYFDSMDSAANYAKDTWGVPYPTDLKPYTSKQLFGIGKKVKAWKLKKKLEEEREENEDVGFESPLNEEGVVKMASVFNYSKYMAIVKEAMGAKHQENRDDYYWWTLDELLAGGDDNYKMYVEDDPSLRYVLNVAAGERAKKTRKLMEMYNLKREQINNVLKYFVGYDPEYGAYICAVSPYVSEGYIHGMEHRRPEAVDRFSFFTLKINRADSEESKLSIAKKILDYNNSFGVNLDPSDLQMELVVPPLVSDPNRLNQKRETVESVESLDENNTRYKDLLSRNALLTSAKISPNSRGMEKIIRKQWGDLYGKVVAEKAREMGMTEQDVVDNVVSDADFLRSIYSAITKKYEDAVKTGDASILGMTEPPAFTKLFAQKTSGQLGFTEVTKSGKINKTTARQLAMEKEVADVIMSGASTPEQIQAALNSRPERKNNPIGMDIVENMVDDIMEKATSQNKTVEQISAELGTSIHSILTTDKGFASMGDALKAAKIYFTKMNIDKATKAKLGEKFTSKKVFDQEENFQNVSTQDLVSKKPGEPIPTRDLGDLVSGEEVKEEIGPEIKEIPEIEQPEQSESEEFLVNDIGEEPQEKTPIAPEIESEEEKRKRKELEELPDFDNILGNTIKSLIRIASDLDKENKFYAAEEIHKIIRKYAGDTGYSGHSGDIK